MSAGDGARRTSLHRAKTEYGTVFLNETTGEYWHVNESAEVVVDALQDGGSSDDAADALVRHYGIDAARARRDVDAVMSRLSRLGVA